MCVCIQGPRQCPPICFPWQIQWYLPTVTSAKVIFLSKSSAAVKSVSLVLVSSPKGMFHQSGSRNGVGAELLQHLLELKNA